MVEAQKAPDQKFKFCYILRGLPGCGKSTVAKQLAGVNGKILNLDTNVNKHAIQGGAKSDEAPEIREKHFAEFCAEIDKGTPIIVVDNMNIQESEYMHLVHKAQQEHYFTSVVTLPVPEDLEGAAERSKHNVTKSEMTALKSLYEPTSLKSLIDKGDAMHQERLSPRHSNKILPISHDNPRRQSSYGLPVQNAIIEDMNSSDDDNQEEVKAGQGSDNKPQAEAL